VTEHNSELLSSMVIKRHRDGRRRFDAKAKRALVERCLQPGVSMAGLALERSVNANLLRKWIMRYQQERDDATTAALPAPVETSAFVPVATLNASPRTQALRLQARLGRKNFLHFGSGSGGERGAAIYTLVATAKLNGLDPEAYLRHVLSHIDHSVNQVSELLPRAVADQLL
jgi:transposase-like protein